MPIDIATGDVELARDDFVLPGRVPIKWTRRYRSAQLGSIDAPLGPGWSTSWFPTLARVNKAWRFVSPEGDENLFPEPDGQLNRGQVIRLLGAFLEIIRQDHRYIVTQWDVESGEITRFVFAANGSPDAPPLVAIENVSGDGVDLARDTRGRLISLRQRAENRTVLVNSSADGRISSLVLATTGGAGTELVRYGYDSAGRFAVAIDRRGLANRYEYDAQSRLSREILRDGAVYTYRYDEKGRCIHFSGLDHYNEKRVRFLDAANAIIVTDSYGKSTSYERTPSGQIAGEVDPSGNQRKTIFDEFNRIVARIEPTGAITRYTYDEHGNRNSITDALGHTTWFQFNTLHQPISLTDPLGKTWLREYNAQHRLAGTVNPLGARWTIAYDSAGNPALITDPLGSTRRLRYEDDVPREMTDWMGHPTRFNWDEFGRVTERVGPVGDRTAVRYDPAGNPTEVELPDGGRLRATYDSGDNLSSFSNSKGHTTRFRYGSCRRLLERVDPIGRVVRYVWGSAPDRLDQVINEKGEAFTYFRDDRGRVVRERSFDGREQSFAYDPEGRCIAFTNGNGEKIQLKRDIVGRLVKQVLPDDAVTRYEYDPVGRILAAVNPDIPVKFEYDDAGRLVREIQGEEWVRTDYNAAGEVIRTQTSLGHEVRYDLDPNGRVARLTTGDNHSLAFERDARGLETGRQMPGGVRLEQRFDSMGRLLEQRVGPALSSARVDPVSGRETRVPAGHEIIKRDYQYDPDGLLLSIKDGRWGMTDYAYDPAERLLSALRDQGLSEHFEYDATDNLTRMQEQGRDPKDHSCTYGPGNRLLQRGDTLYEHDADGRLIRKTESASSDKPQVWQYKWDAQGQLRKLLRPDGAEWKYKYDAFGRRISKHGPDRIRHCVWNGNVIIHERANDQQPIAWLMKQASFAPLAKVEEGSLFTIVNDHLGTPREIMDESGKLVWGASFTAWGQVDQKQSFQPEQACPIRFQGQWYDDESGLRYNRFRYYDSNLGRYISGDPIRLRNGLNLFGYVPTPTQWIDPLGLTPQCMDVREEDVSGGPHAPDRTLNQVMSRAAGTGNPQGQWGSREAATRAAGQYDPVRGGVQVVPIAPGDGRVVHHPVMSYPPRAGEPTVVQGGVTVSRGGPEIVPADHAIIIPKPDGLHTFPIDATHANHPSNQP